MTDVRLTALNPDDSKVYPVACNENGELRTVGLGNDVEILGELTVNENATFKSSVFSGDISCADSKIDLATAGNAGELRVRDSSGEITASITGTTGSAEFAGEVVVDSSASNGFGLTVTNSSSPKTFGTLYARNNGLDGSPCYQAASNQGDIVCRIDNDGSADFAGGNAGFTAEGYLWCTTRRGDTVILDATSNGIGSWVAYTPVTRDSLRGKPEVSQDLPETQ